MRFTVALPLFILLCGAAEPPQQPTLPTPIAPDVTAIDLAIGENGSRMTVPVSISGAGPYPFIVDTGAERSVISRELASTLGLLPGRDVRIWAMTDMRRVNTFVIPRLAVNALGDSRVEAPALDARNLGAPGLLGVDTLQGRAITIDFTKQIMSVQPSESRRRALPREPGEIVVRAKSLYGQLVVTDARFGAHKVRVILDTGSSVSIGNPALRAKLGRSVKTIQAITLTSVTGEQLHAEYTQVPRVRVGAVEFGGMPVAFTDAAPFRRFGLTKEPALMLGMDALRLFREVKIDFANQEIRFAMPVDTRMAAR
jgi:predicted aspartyl protease